MTLCTFAYPDLYSVTNEQMSVSHGCYKDIYQGISGLLGYIRKGYALYL